MQPLVVGQTVDSAGKYFDWHPARSQPKYPSLSGDAIPIVIAEEFLSSIAFVPFYHSIAYCWSLVRLHDENPWNECRVEIFDGPIVSPFHGHSLIELHNRLQRFGAAPVGTCAGLCLLFSAPSHIEEFVGGICVCHRETSCSPHTTTKAFQYLQVPTQ